MLIRDGGVIAPGYDAELDQLRDLSTNADQFLLDLEARERERTGIATLKVGYNRVHGYYIELGRAQADQVPAGLCPPPDPQGRGALYHPGTQALRGRGAEQPGARPGPGKGALRGTARRP